jgi:cytochrome c oxidase subunit 2
VAGTSAQGQVGPELTNFANNPQIAGVIENNEDNLRAWLEDPPAVKPGTAMPNLGLTPQQIDALVAYLYTLDGSGGQ